MRLNKPYISQYQNVHSPESTEFILTIESTIGDTLGESVNRVEVTSLTPGSVVVDMNVHTDSTATSINSVLQNAANDGRLAAIGADAQTQITAQGKN